MEKSVSMQHPWQPSKKLLSPLLVAAVPATPLACWSDPPIPRPQPSCQPSSRRLQQHRTGMLLGWLGLKSMVLYLSLADKYA